MSTTPITNIYHPDNATPAQDVTTLGAMADSIETAMLNLPRKFANFTALEAWTPANGALAFVQADSRLYVREGSTWRIVQARHVTDNASNGRAYFGTGDNGFGDTYLVMSPTGDSAAPGAFSVSHDGVFNLIVYKSGNVFAQNDFITNNRVVSPHIPYAMAVGTVVITPTGSNQVSSATVTMPIGRFTRTPEAFATAKTGALTQIIGAAAVPSSASAITVYMNRTTNFAGTITWQAIQMSENSSTG